tara:strand:+ start:451 stop:678 length:228 start_codon:yes stop_codon:yes gene_type:complete
MTDPNNGQTPDRVAIAQGIADRQAELAEQSRRAYHKNGKQPCDWAAFKDHQARAMRFQRAADAHRNRSGTQENSV